MTDWIARLGELASRGESSFLLTVAGIRGSAPRETGAKMIVTGSGTIGTIGGGQLEHQCAQIACEQLLSTEPPVNVINARRFALGSGCGQCCGGVVDVLFEFLEGSRAEWLRDLRQLHQERTPALVATSAETTPAKLVISHADAAKALPREVQVGVHEMLASGTGARMVGSYLLEPVRQPDFNIVVFGAGHVGSAVVDVVSRLDCHIRWIDTRRNVFPGRLPPNVAPLESATPAREVAAMPPSSYYLIMTHSHPLDLDICDQVLKRDDVAYCGLIGSMSKRRRFERLLKKQGVSREKLATLVCPIGIAGIDGKKPAEIALAVAAELLRERSACSVQAAAPRLMDVSG